jgi:hypothetical protein
MSRKSANPEIDHILDMVKVWKITNMEASHMIKQIQENTIVEECKKLESYIKSKDYKTQIQKQKDIWLLLCMEELIPD